MIFNIILLAMYFPFFIILKNRLQSKGIECFIMSQSLPVILHFL